jgi:hypothetical protein
MPRKQGPDIRNGNWLFYDDQLLTTLMGAVPATTHDLKVVSPGELADIISESDDIILTAMEALAQRARETSPNPKKSVAPAWIYTAKMVPAGSKMARGTVLSERAFDRQFSKVTFQNPRDFLPSSREYLERSSKLGYSARLLLDLGGWNAVRDGGWLQIQPTSAS